jgi:hypothetical protein
MARKPPAPASYTEAINRFPSAECLAAAIRVPGSTCRSWRARDAIPPGYFGLIGAAAQQLGVAVSAKELWALFQARDVYE